MQDSTDDPRLSELYRHADKVTVPEHIEKAVLTQARQQADINARQHANAPTAGRWRLFWQQYCRFNWQSGLSFAVLAGLAVSTVIMLQQQQPVPTVSPALIYRPKAVITEPAGFTPTAEQQTQINRTLARIRTLKSAGEIAAARQLATELHQQYPQLTLADDIKALTEPTP